MKRLLDPAERQKKIHGEITVQRRAAGFELDTAAKAFFRQLPFPVACKGYPQRIVRLAQQRVQLDRLFRYSSHPSQIINRRVQVSENTRLVSVIRGETRVSEGKRGVFG